MLASLQNVIYALDNNELFIVPNFKNELYCLGLRLIKVRLKIVNISRKLVQVPEPSGAF